MRGFLMIASHLGLYEVLDKFVAGSEQQGAASANFRALHQPVIEADSDSPEQQGAATASEEEAMVGQVKRPAAPSPVPTPCRKRARTDAFQRVAGAKSAKSLYDGVQLPNAKPSPVIMPAVGFGTYKMKKGEAKEPVLSALRAGYRLIDTAQVYENEKDVGLAMKESGLPRSEIFLETKVWRSSHGYERTLKACKQSLKKAGVDYIDLYMIHWPGCKTGWPLPRGTSCPKDWTPAMRDEGTWRAMEELYDEGKVRAIGVCNYSVRHLQLLLKKCRVKPMVNQVEFHPKLVQSELLKFCKENGILVQAYASLGSGDAGNPQEFFDLPPVAAAAKAHNVKPAQVLLRWALEKGLHIIPKSCKAVRMAQNADLFHFNLTSAEVKAIDACHVGQRQAWKGLDPDTIK